MKTYYITYSTPDEPCLRTVRHSQQATIELVEKILNNGGQMIEVRVEG